LPNYKKSRPEIFYRTLIFIQGTVLNDLVFGFYFPVFMSRVSETPCDLMSFIVRILCMTQCVFLQAGTGFYNIMFITFRAQSFNINLLTEVIKTRKWMFSWNFTYETAL